MIEVALGIDIEFYRYFYMNSTINLEEYDKELMYLSMKSNNSIPELENIEFWRLSRMKEHYMKITEEGAKQNGGGNNQSADDMMAASKNHANSMMRQARVGNAPRVKF
jgi:hypothetical protein